MALGSLSKEAAACLPKGLQKGGVRTLIKGGEKSAQQLNNLVHANGVPLPGPPTQAQAKVIDELGKYFSVNGRRILSPEQIAAIRSAAIKY